MKVLVVDDNRDLSELVRNFFIGRTGYDVEVADSGFAAGLTVARFKPQVILMDILMPEMDGFEVLRQLQDHPDTRDIPVIAWTAYHDARIEARVRREAFVAYVKKSEPLERLAAVVDRAVIKGAVREPG